MNPDYEELDSGIIVPGGGPAGQLLVPRHAAQEFAETKEAEALALVEAEHERIQGREQLLAEEAELQVQRDREVAIRNSRKIEIKRFPDDSRSPCQGKVQNTKTKAVVGCATYARWSLKIVSTVKKPRRGGMFKARSGNFGSPRRFCWDHLPEQIQKYLIANGDVKDPNATTLDLVGANG